MAQALAPTQGAQQPRWLEAFWHSEQRGSSFYLRAIWGMWICFSLPSETTEDGVANSLHRSHAKWHDWTRFFLHLMRMRKVWHHLGQWLKEYTYLKARKPLRASRD